MDVLEIIADCARRNEVVKIQYTKVATGETKTYLIEPYSIRGDYLYGFDVVDNKIKKFLISNILTADGTESTFTPRWTVEF